MSDGPRIDSEVSRLLDYLRRLAPRGSKKRRQYECALTVVRDVNKAEADRRDKPPERKHPLRLVK